MDQLIIARCTRSECKKTGMQTKCGHRKRLYLRTSLDGERFECSLDAWEDETHKAYIRIGEIIKDVEAGRHPKRINRRIGQSPFTPRHQRERGIYERHILRFFGSLRVTEVDAGVIESYIKHRWGDDAPESTVKKELRVLKNAIQQIVPGWELPPIKYQKRRYQKKQPLTWDQIVNVMFYVYPKYQDLYWVLAYTAMDVSDGCKLAPCHIQGSFIDIKRGKTGQRCRIPIMPGLAELLSSLPVPLKPETPYFGDLVPKNAATYIRRGFTRAGLKGYSAKDLRRYLPSRLIDLGYQMDWIRPAIGHADKSAQTEKYVGVYDEALERAFKEAYGG